MAQFLRFLISGAAGMAVYNTVIYLLTEFFGVWYVASMVAAFLAQSSFIFTINRLWTFKSFGDVWHKFRKVFAVKASIFLVNLIITHRLVESWGAHYFLAQFVVGAILLPPSFYYQRYIFTKQVPFGPK